MKRYVLCLDSVGGPARYLSILGYQAVRNAAAALVGTGNGMVYIRAAPPSGFPLSAGPIILYAIPDRDGVRFCRSWA